MSLFGLDRANDPSWQIARGLARQGIASGLMKLAASRMETIGLKDEAAICLRVNQIISQLREPSQRSTLHEYIEAAFGGKEVVVDKVDVATYMLTALGTKDITKAKLGLE